MRRVFDLALKDLSQLVRDWKSALFLVVMPVAFTLLFGFAFAGTGGEAGVEDPRLPVGFLDLDGGTLLSANLFKMLQASEAVRPVVVEGTIEGAEKLVREEELAAVVVVPDGYTDHIVTGVEENVELIVDADSPAGSTALNSVQAAVTRLRGAEQAARLTGQALLAHDRLANVKPVYLAAFDDAVAAWNDPSLTVTVAQSRADTPGTSENGEATGEGPANDFSHSSAGMMVQFSLAGMMGAGEILVLERKSRALQRLLTTAISRAEIILGHYLAMFVMVFVQLLVLAAFNQLVLNVAYFSQPVALLVVLVPNAAWSASLGLLIGVLARTEEQVIVMSIILMLVLSGLGGAWMPLEFTSETFQAVAHFTPMAWTMDGLTNLILRGLGVESVLLPGGILLAYGILFFLLAVWRFRFE